MMRAHYMLVAIIFYASAWAGTDSSPSYTARLEPVQQEFSLPINISFKQKNVPFTKEPDFARKKIVRNALQIGAKDAKPVGFAWDAADKKLYMDFNCDGDLTNDSDNVFTAEEEFSQRFPKIGFSIGEGDSKTPYVLSFEFVGETPEVAITSGWRGVVDLGGPKWRISYADNMDVRYGQGDYFFIEQGDDNLLPLPRVDTDSVGDFAPADAVAFGGAYYGVSITFKSGAPEITLTEQKKPMGKLTVQGQDIRYLRLTPKEGPGNPLRVVLDRPNADQALEVPVGSYLTSAIYLFGHENNSSSESFGRDKGPEFLCARAGRSSDDRFLQGNKGWPGVTVDISENAPATLKAGAPIDNSTEAVREGNTLRLSHKLVGIGGEIYAPSRTDYSNLAAFAVYKDDKKIGHGKFEFG